MKTQSNIFTRSALQFALTGSLVLRKGDCVALRFVRIDEHGNVLARGARHDEEDPETVHNLGCLLSQIVSIPETVTMPDGSTLNTQDRAELAALIRKVDRHFRASAKAWEDRQERMTPERYAALEQREQSEAEKGEALLSPLGIKCSWPGLYPSFVVHGFGEHSTEMAVLAAVGLPRNALRGEIGVRQ